MRILHLEASRGWGGQEIRILKEAEGMRRRGHEIVFGVSKGSELGKKARRAGFLVYHVPFQRIQWVGAFFLLLWIFRAHRIDWVNTHSSLDAWIGGIAARFAKRKIIRTRHLSHPIRGKFNSKILYGKLADCVATTCEEIVGEICESSGKSKNLCRSIPTGIDPQQIQENLGAVSSFRKTLPFPRDAFLVGTACVLRSWKGIDDLLKAASILKTRKNIRWVIIGGGHIEGPKRKVEELGLEEIVHFTGHLDSPFAAIEALDLFALLSTSAEGVSQALLQAAFLQKPLIATPTGGLKEVCIDGKTGILVPPFSSGAVAEAVLFLEKEEALRKSFGESAKSLVLEKFTFDQTLDAMEALLNCAQ